MSKASTKDIALAIRQILKEGASSEDVVRKISSYLVDQRRSRDLDRIMREVERLQLIEDNVLEVTASSAKPLSDEAKQGIDALFGDHEVRIINKIEPELVGGVRLRTLDSELDLSVRGQLKRLKNAKLGEI